MYERAGGDTLHMYTIVDNMLHHVRETFGLLYTQRSARGEIQQKYNNRRTSFICYISFVENIFVSKLL